MAGSAASEGRAGRENVPSPHFTSTEKRQFARTQNGERRSSRRRPRRPGCGPASSGAGSALLRGCGTLLAAPEAEWHGARHPGLGRGEPAVPSRPPWPALPLAVHLPRAARRRSLPAAVQKFGAPLRLPASSTSLVTGVNTVCLAEARGRLQQECAASAGL